MFLRPHCFLLSAASNCCSTAFGVVLAVFSYVMFRVLPDGLIVGTHEPCVPTFCYVLSEVLMFSHGGEGWGW